MIYNIESIRHVHLEISSFCNARCPLCPRNFYGYPYNDGYVEHNMTLKEAQKIFAPEFVRQLEVVHINGNFGDAVMNPDTVDIVQYFKTCNKDLSVDISTNGGARDRNFWQSLAKLDVEIDFCIDGLEDTHSLYRQNTEYHTVLKNANIFIAAGGRATWKMIKFEHNQHQIEQAKQLADQMKFIRFSLVDHGRNQGPVFDKNKKLVHVMKKPQTVDFEALFQHRTQGRFELSDVVNNSIIKPISCEVKKTRSVYVSSTGYVYPCCYLGFNPQSYGHGNYLAVGNQQLRPLLHEHNALEHSLQHCIEWFNDVEKSWQIPSFEQGRLIICNDTCGQKQ